MLLNYQLLRTFYRLLATVIFVKKRRKGIKKYVERNTINFMYNISLHLSSGSKFRLLFLISHYFPKCLLLWTFPLLLLFPISAREQFGDGCSLKRIYFPLPTIQTLWILNLSHHNIFVFRTLLKAPRISLNRLYCSTILIGVSVFSSWRSCYFVTGMKRSCF